MFFGIFKKKEKLGLLVFVCTVGMQEVPLPPAHKQLSLPALIKLPCAWQIAVNPLI